MKYIFIITISLILASCGPSPEEKKSIAAVTCSIMGETKNMDGAIRVEKLNDARKEIGGEPFLKGDDAIKEAFEYGLCQKLVLNENYNKDLKLLKDAKEERERVAEEKRAEEIRVAEEKQRVADSTPSVKEEFHLNGNLKSRTNYKAKTDGGAKHGLSETFFENGQLEERSNYVKGKLLGRIERYNLNGTRIVDESETTTENEIVYLDQSGKPFTGIMRWTFPFVWTGEKTFRDGILHGPSYRYETKSKGKLLKTTYYENGKKHGQYALHNIKKGGFFVLGNYREDKLHGEYLWWYPNNKRREVKNYKDGQLDGLFEKFEEEYGYSTNKTCYKNDEITDMSYCKQQ
tara:strand:- start:461 stop:1498 length:1038 start_codon:yes stop_codon:yes gene_type:complete